jgi:hypothetical protein
MEKGHTGDLALLEVGHFIRGELKLTQLFFLLIETVDHFLIGLFEDIDNLIIDLILEVNDLSFGGDRSAIGRNVSLSLLRDHFDMCLFELLDFVSELF